MVFRALHVSNGDVHSFGIEEYDDNGEPIKVKIVTDIFDGQTAQRKFLSRLVVVGDLIGAGSASNITMRYTDNDYKTWSNAQSRDMRYIPVFPALGSFNRRAFEFTYDDNYPFRLDYAELALKLGGYAQGIH